MNKNRLDNKFRNMRMIQKAYELLKNAETIDYIGDSIFFGMKQIRRGIGTIINNINLELQLFDDDKYYMQHILFRMSLANGITKRSAIQDQDNEFEFEFPDDILVGFNCKDHLVEVDETNRIITIDYGKGLYDPVNIKETLIIRKFLNK